MSCTTVSSEQQWSWSTDECIRNHNHTQKEQNMEKLTIVLGGWMAP